MPTARAAVLNAVREPLSVDALEVRGPRDGEVLVRVAAAGVCHSDMHAITGDLPMPRRNHFSVIDGLADESSALFTGARRLMKLDK